MKIPPLQNVRVISFDVFGTLVVPNPSIGHIYARCLRLHGADDTGNDLPAILNARFPVAYQKVRAAQGEPLSESAARKFWEQVVRETCEAVCPRGLFAVVFAEAYAAFSQGKNWKVLSGARRTLRALQFLGYRLAAFTNADARMRTVLEELQLAEFFEQIFTSTELGRAKPGAAAFLAVSSALDVAPVDVLHVGDSLKEDVEGALGAGMRAAWLAPDTHFRPAGATVVLRKLEELPELLRLADTAHLRRKPTRRVVRDLVANLRGLPEEAAWGPRRRHEDSERAIGAVILEVASKLSAEAKPLDMLRSHWGEIIAAPALAAKCEPHRISPDGTLAVHCTGAVVRSELQMRSRMILQAIRRHRACAKVQRVNFHL